MNKLTFLVATYNEENEILDLLLGIQPYVDRIVVSDDGSTDDTTYLANFVLNTSIVKSEHIGLPETVKDRGLQEIEDGSWVLMLDADERIVPVETLTQIRDFIDSDEGANVDYVYFNQYEILDGHRVRTFQKCKLFRKEAIQFPLHNIHADDVFTGNGIFREDWLVHHRKTAEKQILREMEYLVTYKKLLDDGKIDEGRYLWLISLHHFVVPHG